MTSNRSYDLRSLPFGESLIAEVQSVMSEDYRSSLRQVAQTNTLPQFLQFPSATQDELMTLGDLRRTGENENAEQFVDFKALRKVLFGRHGIAKSSRSGQDHARLALPIQVCYTRYPYTEELTSPVISSGRHRLLALLALMYAAGVDDSVVDGLSIRITSVVVSDHPQFSQLMENNNSSRTQSTHELKVHSLSGKGIPTNDVESLLEFNYRATDAGTQKEMISQLVSLYSRGHSDATFAFDVAGVAWTALKKSNADKQWVKDLFADADVLARVTEQAAKSIADLSATAQEDPLSTEIKQPVARGLSKVLARALSLVEPTFPTPQEEYEMKTLKAEQRAREMREKLQKQPAAV
jgi:hypothetical protein